MDDPKLEPNTPESALDRTQHSTIFSNVKEIRSISARYVRYSAVYILLRNILFWDHQVLAKKVAKGAQSEKRKVLQLNSPDKHFRKSPKVYISVSTNYVAIVPSFEDVQLYKMSNISGFWRRFLGCLEKTCFWGRYFPS